MWGAPETGARGGRVCGEVLKVLEVYGQVVAFGGGLAGFCA